METFELLKNLYNNRVICYQNGKVITDDFEDIKRYTIA